MNTQNEDDLDMDALVLWMNSALEPETRVDFAATARLTLEEGKRGTLCDERTRQMLRRYLEALKRSVEREKALRGMRRRKAG